MLSNVQKGKCKCPTDMVRNISKTLHMVRVIKNIIRMEKPEVLHAM